MARGHFNASRHKGFDEVIEVMPELLRRFLAMAIRARLEEK